MLYPIIVFILLCINSFKLVIFLVFILICMIYTSEYSLSSALGYRWYSVGGAPVLDDLPTIVVGLIYQCSFTMRKGSEEYQITLYNLKSHRLYTDLKVQYKTLKRNILMQLRRLFILRYWDLIMRAFLVF